MAGLGGFARLICSRLIDPVVVQGARPRVA